MTEGNNHSRDRTETLLDDWLLLPDEQRHSVLLRVQETLAQKLGLSEDALQPAKMHVYAFLKRPSTLALHLAVDDTVYRDVQSGSEVMEHYVWTCEVALTPFHALISVDTELAYQRDVIEYEWAYYRPQDVVKQVADTAAGKL